ncbi:sugar ABC transporter ATP-binding protein [Microbacterium candidum]|uniref:Sugar ABC transporter ATP-binding protein n=1 Tax=Microbacterium candidum TaxID=3041922 RepID=A0ABT7MW43_9MICO|nr:sugar ABC transporter ATP-binding protein [Microbacterium sp. ASV49]MDL9978671.1 sugar ABC transporter ATP-binding protein [Microbacterium sp. ASV49]
MDTPHIIRLTGVTKRFGGQAAVSDVDLAFRRGEIHALVGENGAGKSTLCSIIAGAQSADEGELVVDGRTVSFDTPAAALAAGISLIAQEVALVPALTVRENVFLGREPNVAGVLTTKELERRYAQLDARIGFGIPSRARVGSLPFSSQQKVEILRALARESRVIILDEPTAALGPGDAALLFDALEELRADGATIVFISHHLDEVLAISDRVTILRDGRVVRTADTADETHASLIAGMLGRPLTSVFPPKAPAGAGEPILSVRGLTRRGAFEDVSFDLHPGEILGVAGLVGAGRSEVARAIFGADPVDRGEILLRGRRIRARSPRHAKTLGLAMVPESRRNQGLVLALPVDDNLTMATMDRDQVAGIVRTRKVAKAATDMVRRLDIRLKKPGVAVERLSGGNQQKVLFGKWLMTDPKVLIVDEPTRGVDVGAKKSIYELIADLASNGVAVLLISSELEEILGLAHRVVVMNRGRVSAQLEGDDLTERSIMSAAFASEQQHG